MEDLNKESDILNQLEPTPNSKESPISSPSNQNIIPKDDIDLCLELNNLKDDNTNSHITNNMNNNLNLNLKDNTNNNSISNNNTNTNRSKTKMPSVPKIKQFPSNNDTINNPNRNMVIKTNTKPTNAYDNIYEEDMNYRVESTSKLNTDEKHDKSTIPNNYFIEKLENKIQEQAKRLSELNNYKFLCEKRIRQLNPDETFPITQKSIELGKKIKDLKDKCESSSNRLMINDNFTLQKNYTGSNNTGTNKNPPNNYDMLYDKYVKLLDDYNDLVNNKQNESSLINNNNGNLGDLTAQKYKKLKHKYKILLDEKEKLVDLLRQETASSEEQKNLISLLQQTIESDISKNDKINQYVTVENLVDFTKLKNEIDNYRKQLVLSQALVNSLKAEIEQLNTMNNFDRNNLSKTSQNDINSHNSSLMDKSDKNLIKNNLNLGDTNTNNTNFNNINNTTSNISKQNDKLINENKNLKNKLNDKNKQITNLNEEFNNLRSLVDEAEDKINENINLNSKMGSKMRTLENELVTKKGCLKEYENKFDYFNDYISNIKISLQKLQIIITNYIKMYNNMANEDLHSLLSKNFSDNITNLLNKNNKLCKIEKFNLDNNDIYLHRIIVQLLKILNKEFTNLYEKVFEGNKYFNEHNIKISQLEKQIEINNEENNIQINSINQLNNKINSLNKKNEYINKYFDETELKNNELIDNNNILSKKIVFLNKEKENIILISQILIKLLKSQNPSFNNYINKLFQEALIVINSITKLNQEKLYIQDKIDNFNKNNCMDKKEQTTELFKMIKKEYNTLIQLYNGFQEKINQKEYRFNQIKVEFESIKNNEGVSNISNYIPSSEMKIDKKYNYNYDSSMNSYKIPHHARSISHSNYNTMKSNEKYLGKEHDIDGGGLNLSNNCNSNTCPPTYFIEDNNYYSKNKSRFGGSGRSGNKTLDKYKYNFNYKNSSSLGINSNNILKNYLENQNNLTEYDFDDGNVPVRDSNIARRDYILEDNN